MFSKERSLLIFITIIVLVFNLSITISGQDVLQRFEEIKTEVKKAKQDREFMKVNKLREEAANLVYNINTARVYKEMFPEMYSEYVNTIISKLPYYTYSKDELLELYRLFPDSRGLKQDIEQIILHRAQSLSEVNDVLDIFSDLRVEDYSIRFINDLETLKRYNKMFPNSFNSSSLKELEELLKQNKNINQIEKLNEIKNKVSETDYNSEIYSLKNEALKYVDNYQTAEKFKEIFTNLDQHDKHASQIINRLEYILNREELYKLTKLFPQQRLIDIKKMYLIKSTTLDEIDEALDKFPDLFIDDAKENAIYYVKDLESAMKFKNIFPEKITNNNRILNSIIWSKINTIKSISELKELITNYPELKPYSINKGFELIISAKDMSIYKSIYKNEQKTDIELLNKLDKDELLNIKNLFDDKDIIKKAGTIYLDKAKTIKDLKKASIEFPELKNEILEISLSKIDSIEKAVEVKNNFTDLKEEAAVRAIKHVNNLDTVKIFRNHFYADKYKEEIIKKMIVGLTSDKLKRVLDIYAISNKNEVLNLNRQYRDVKIKVDQLRKENPRFKIQGEMIDRDKEDILLWGKAIPANGDYNTYGTLIEDSNIIVRNYEKDYFNVNFYNGGYHFLLGKEKGESKSGQAVPVWIYGDIPDELKTKENKLNKIEKILII